MLRVHALYGRVGPPSWGSRARVSAPYGSALGAEHPKPTRFSVDSGLPTYPYSGDSAGTPYMYISTF